MHLPILLVPALLIVILFFVPIEFEGSVVLGKRPKIRIGWLFGLIRKDLFDETSARKAPSYEEDEKRRERAVQKPPAKVPEKEPEGKDRGWTSRDLLSIIQTEGLIGNLKRLLKGLSCALRVSHLRARFRMGFEDPADTGRAAGYLWSAAGYLESLYPIDVDVEPSFYEEALEFEGEGTLRVWPALVVLPLFRFALSMPTLKTAWKTMKIRRKKR